MRRFILIAAVYLVSATAYAGPTRSLSLASSDTIPAAETEQQPAGTPPTAVERPKLVASDEQAPVVADKPLETAKPKRKHVSSTEARIIYELHRHGVYW
jgi:hypothetical protein